MVKQGMDKGAGAEGSRIFTMNNLEEPTVIPSADHRRFPFALLTADYASR